MMKLLLCLILFGTLTASPDQHEEIFTNTYTKKRWGVNEENKAHSGNSSTKESTVLYRKLLQNFLNEYEIQSVVDLGCGDWEFSQLIDWTNINYYGYDVVFSVVQKNIERFSSPNISFFYENFFEAELPQADLLICKNVLQHFSNKDIHDFLQITKRFKYCLITNRVAPNTNSENFTTSFRWRGVALEKPPFNVQAKLMLSYIVDRYPTEVLLINNSRKP